MAVVGTAVLELTGDTAQFRAEMNRAASVFEGTGRKLQAVGATLSRRVTLPILAVGAGAIAGATKIDSLRRALVAVAGSTEEADRQLVELKEAARLPGLGFAEAIEGAVRLQAVGVSAERSTRLLKAFGNAIATTGGGRAELARVTLQLGQLSAKGRILAQDLRPIIEAAPAVGRALLEAFGTVDPQDIEELGITTDQFLDRLVEQLEKLPAVTGGPRNAFENLQDSLLRAGDAVGKVLLPAITSATNSATAFLEKIAELDPAFLRLAVGVAAFAAALGPLIGLFKRLTTVVAAMIPFIGVGGVIALGITAVVGAFAAWKLATRNQTEEQEKLNSALDDFNAAIAGADPAQQLKLAKGFARATANDLAAARDRVAELEQKELDLRNVTGARVLEYKKVNDQLESERANVKKLESDLAGAEAAVKRLSAVAPTTTNRRTAKGDEIADIFADLQRELSAATVLNDALGDSFDLADARADAYRSAIEALAEAGVSLTAQVGPQGESIESLSGKYIELAAAIDANSAAERRNNQLRAEGAALTNALLTPIEEYRAELARIGELVQAEAISQETAIRAVVRAAEAYRNATAGFFFKGIELPDLSAVGESANQAADQFTELGLTIDTFASAGVDAFARFATGSKDVFKDFIDFAVRQLARLLLLDIARNFFAGFLGGLLGGIVGGGASGGAAVFFKGVALAGGGPARRGHPYLIGEKGPELFVPNASGTVVPNHALGGGVLRMDTGSLPPRPVAMTPEALATDDWWRRAFSHLSLDYGARGGL